MSNRRRAFVLGLILTGSGLAMGDTVDPELRRQAEQSLANGRAALLQQTRVTVDVVWTLGNVLEIRPDEPLQAWTDERAAELSGDRFARLIDPEAPRVVLPEDPGQGMFRLSNYIMAAVGSPASRAVRFIDEYTAIVHEGYALTHQVFVIQWATETGLVLPARVRRRLPGLVKRVAAEQAAEPPFRDLYAESVALLLLYGAPGNQDVERWTRKIVAEQQEDGSWGSNHTDAFCLLALTLALERD